jgi:predicted nucleic acid-binding protein
MGLSAKLRGKTVYFDTNIFIYLFEGSATFHSQILELQSLVEHQEITVISCDLVYSELLPPIVHDTGAMQTLLNFLNDSAAFTIVPVNRETFIHAGILRGETGMKTPDALHVASAMQAECDFFLTNDKKLQTPDKLEKIIISDF